MTPYTPESIKAKELFQKYSDFLWYGIKISPDEKYDLLRQRGKEAALICVSEIIKAKDGLETFPNENEYWESVKKEINKL